MSFLISFLRGQNRIPNTPIHDIFTPSKSNDITTIFLKYLSGRDLAALVLTDKMLYPLHQALNDQRIWEQKCRDEFPDKILNKRPDITWQEHYRNCFRDNTLSSRCTRAYENGYRNLSENLNFIQDLVATTSICATFMVVFLFTYPLLYRTNIKLINYSWPFIVKKIHQYTPYLMVDSTLNKIHTLFFSTSGIFISCCILFGFHKTTRLLNTCNQIGLRLGRRIEESSCVKRFFGTIGGSYNYIKTWIKG